MPINWPLWSPECSKLRVPTATKGVFDRLLLSIIIILDIWALRNPKFIGEKKKNLRRRLDRGSQNTSV